MGAAMQAVTQALIQALWPSRLPSHRSPGGPLTGAFRQNDISDRVGQIMKRTYQASKVRRARTHGFLVRMKSRGGRAVINARRAKGRKRLAV